MFVLVHLGVRFRLYRVIPAGTAKGAAGAEVRSEEREAHHYLDFPGLEAESRAAFATFSVGRDLEMLLNSLFNRFKTGLTIPSFLTEAASGTQTWPKMALKTSGQKKEGKCIHLAEV